MNQFLVQPFHHLLSLISWVKKPGNDGPEETARISGNRDDGAKEPLGADCNANEAYL
jgi:hypothetical protein